VLATNVAETSLTVPGIRYVIDAGTARVKRYSFRSKVEQLLVEPISQAAANQRAGRCGRVANGICIRLYDEADFNSRPRFTDPEILRSSLAGVILRMKSLHLGDVAQFPFIEAPSGRAIADGYQLLSELGAVDDANELTPMGVELSKLPLDPRVGRMILEARERGALDEVLVIASALSVQDVRDRPLEAQQQADQAHAKFDDEKSEFSGYLKLWKWINEARGGAPSLPSARAQKAMALKKAPSQAILPVGQRAAAPAAATAATPEVRAPTHKLSNRQYEQLLRQNFISIRRLREWRDIHTQLLTVVTEHGWRINTQPASYEQIHLSMLAGLLGNVGCKLERRGRLVPGRARHQVPQAPRRAPEQEAGPLDRGGRTGGDHAPVWPGHCRHRAAVDGADGRPPAQEADAGPALGEKGRPGGGAGARHAVRHRGLQQPPRGLWQGGPARRARDLHPRGAGGQGEWETRLPFLAANQKLIAKVEELEHKSAARTCWWTTS
jgi:ATP-dependent helicase HrpA